jgi:hypothetical protein
MPFRFSDLMISVLPTADENPAMFGRGRNVNADCPLGTLCFPGTVCPWIFTMRFLPSILCQPLNPNSLEELVMLKGQLQQALAQVEAREEAMNEMMRPQTVAEAQALEEKMMNALEELRLQKEELQKKAAGGQDSPQT